MVDLDLEQTGSPYKEQPDTSDYRPLDVASTPLSLLFLEWEWPTDLFLPLSLSLLLPPSTNLALSPALTSSHTMKQEMEGTRGKNGPSDSMGKYFWLETIFGRVKGYADPRQIDFIFTYFDIGNDEYRYFVRSSF